MSIHPSAVVAPEASLGAGVWIGPFCVVGPDVVLEDEVRLESHVVVQGRTRIGAGCRIYSHAAVGTEPQDLKYAGEPTRVEIGSGTVLRECVTVNRGTGHGAGVTRVGSHCLLMAYAHVAHDCQVGDGVILANAIAMAGHVHIGSRAVIGGLTAIHQFVRIGRLAMVGGASAVTQDVIPFGMVVGNRAKLVGLNLVGLRRAGIDGPVLESLKSAFRLLVRSGLNTSQALERMESELAASPEVAELAAFIRESERGVCKG